MGFSVSSKIKLNMPVVKQLDRAKQGGCIFIPSIISAVRKTLPPAVNGSLRGLRVVHGRIFAVGHL